MKQLVHFILLLSSGLAMSQESAADSPVINSTTNCPEDWLSFDRFCYKAVYGSGKTFLEARAHCQSMRADLMWLESKEELSWATEPARFNIKANWDQCGSDCGSLESAWIGLYFLGADLSNTTGNNKSNQWLWMRDRSSINLDIVWLPGHPRSTPNDFVSLTESASKAEFRTDPKSQKMFSICKMDPELNRGPCPSEDWLQYNGFCYILVKGSSGRTLSEAVSDCQSRDSAAHLLWITSEDELSWVTNNSARNWTLREDYRADCKDCKGFADAAWTGLYRDVRDNQFKWLKDNSTLSVNVSWWLTSPVVKDHAYLAETDSGFYWRTHEQTVKHYHFCKAPAGALNYTTIRPNSTTAADPRTASRTVTVNGTTSVSTTEHPTTLADRTTANRTTTVNDTTSVLTTEHPTTLANGTTADPTTSRQVTTISPNSSIICPSTEWLAAPPGAPTGCFLLVKGSSGRSFNRARADCRNRHPTADLARPRTVQELHWLLMKSSFSAPWNIAADWVNCSGECADVPAAWIGLARRGGDGDFRWLDGGLVGQQSELLPWWPNHPRQSPANFASITDLHAAPINRQLLVRSEHQSRKLWHLCRVDRPIINDATTLPDATATSSHQSVTTTGTMTNRKTSSGSPDKRWDAFWHSGGLALLSLLPPVLALVCVLVYMYMAFYRERPRADPEPMAATTFLNDDASV